MFDHLVFCKLRTALKAMKAKYILLILAQLFLFASCSLNKNSLSRNSGRSFGGKFETGETQQTTAEKTPFSQVENVNTISDIHPHPETTIANRKQTEKKIRIPINSQQNGGLTRQNAIPNSPADTLPVEKNAQIGFYLALGAIVVGILSNAAATMLAGTLANTTASALLGFLGLIPLGMLIAALILGIVGLKIIKANPGKYRGYGKAVAAIVIPSVLIGLGILFLFFYILIFLLILAAL